MKLYAPEAREQWVFAVVSMGAKEGTPPDYKAVSGPDIEACLRSLDSAKLRNAYQYPVGRYDELGRYCTYKPPIDGAGPGKLILHPLADAEHRDNRWN